MDRKDRTVDQKSPRDVLREIVRLIRVGFGDVQSVLEHQEYIHKAIEAAKRDAARPGSAFEEADRLQLRVLEAEFHRLHGRPWEGMRILESDWKALKPCLETRSLGQPLEPIGDRRLLRQKIWALLHYVFFAYYRVGRQHRGALEYFTRLETIIRTQLAGPDYQPSGTLALCYYFMGFCYRGLRSFRDAEKYFLEAQKEASNRIEKVLARHDLTALEREYELSYKDAFCARILSGLGWVAIQQGALLRAEQVLRAGESMLLNTCQEPLRLYVRATLWMAIRRKSGYDDPAYEESMMGLQNCFETYRTAKYVGQQRRCAAELVRGYLDLAEFGGKDEKEKRQNLNNAEAWLKRLERIAQSDDPKSAARYHLHRARFLIMTDRAEDAEEAVLEAKSAGGAGSQRAMYVLEAMAYFRQGKIDWAYQSAEKALSQTLVFAAVESLQEKRVQDPVLEAECYLLIARVQTTRRDYGAARHYLEKWRVLSNFVDNYYLHHLAGEVESCLPAELPFTMPYDFDVFDGKTREVKQTILSLRDRYEEWLVQSVKTRYPTLSAEQLATVYGKSRFTVARRFNKRENRPKPNGR